jgi:hypothetical protein
MMARGSPVACQSRRLLDAGEVDARTQRLLTVATSREVDDEMRAMSRRALLLGEIIRALDLWRATVQGRG